MLVSESTAFLVVSNRWRVREAVGAVNGPRRKLHLYGCDLDPSQKVDPAALAQAYLDCQIIELAGLTDRRAMEFLAREWGLDIAGESIDDVPQTGGLYVSESGTHRWIFVEPADNPRRCRFTVAHEIGHLVREAIPELERAATSLGTLLPDAASPRLLKYGRCALSRSGQLTRSDKRELDAHDFAAELLMPREGVRRLIRERFPAGCPTKREIAEIVRILVTVYDVSREAAERRIGDLDITAFTEGTNEDLFSPT
jgi:hypothetical protein